MTTQHTPGLWEVGHDGSGAPIITFEARDIATVEAYYKDAEANARLIAAAPEMLAALRDAVEELKHAAYIVNLDEDAIGRAKAAIAKATGEPVMAA